MKNFQIFPSWGVSVHSVEEARFAQEHGVSYLTAGHIFATDCKKERHLRPQFFKRSVRICLCSLFMPLGGSPLKESLEIVQGCPSIAGVCMMSYYMKLSIR